MHTNNLRTLAAVLASALQLACVPDRQSIEVVGTLAPDVTYDETKGTCTITAASAGKRQGEGSMNVAYSSRYLLTVILQNNLELNTGINGNSPPINTTSHNDFLLSEMEIEYSCTDTAQKCATFPRIAPQVTALGGTVLAKSQYTLLVDLLAGEALEKMREKLGEELVAATLSVRFRGTFAHGPEFQSEPYLYGLKFSNVEVADYTCSTSSTPRLVTAYPCPLFNGQDSYIDCSAR